jgi:NAD(P)-dependent dehydrogenase (short-subunit alcohol dehydrogenase family)
MARILVTGSADGLGQMAAARLVAGGHEVVLHARSDARAREALAAVPGASEAFAGELSSLASTRALAERVGRCDAVIHNAAIGYREPSRALTADGFERVFQVNVLAPYVLTALMERPGRLVYLSSGLHAQGSVRLDDLQWEHRAWDGLQAYSDSKLLDTLLAFAVARRWSDVVSAAVDPGWVATKMGGAGAPGDLDAAPDTQVWIASGEASAEAVAGRLLFHRAPVDAHPAAHDLALQDGLLDACAVASGITLPS